MLIKIVFSSCNNVTLKASTAIRRSNLQSIKTIYVLLIKSFFWLSAPKKLQVAWQNLLSKLTIDNLIDISSITYVCITYEAKCITRDSLQHREQWVHLLQCCHLSIFALSSSVLVECELWSCSSLCLYFLNRISSSSVNLCLTISQTLVELSEIRSYFLVVISLPELKVSRTLEELTHTLWLTNTRHFNHESTFLTFQLLDIWLYNTILVDTVCYDIV